MPSIPAAAAPTPPMYHPPRPHPVIKQAYAAATPKKYQEVRVTPEFVCAGMVLSRDLVSQRGAKLLQRGAVILPDQVDGIKNFLKRNELKEVYVLKPC